MKALRNYLDKIKPNCPAPELLTARHGFDKNSGHPEGMMSLS